MSNYSTIPSTGVFGNTWGSRFNLTQGPSGLISAAGWTVGNEGFIQQTFLGASIRNFNVTAGFGDTSSNLSVQLVDDEYNISDGLEFGQGDDPYHNGQKDSFIPPGVGTPVFFKFGKTFASIGEAWIKTYDDLYGYNSFKEEFTYEITSSGKFPTEFPENTYVDLENPNPKSGKISNLNTMQLNFVDETALYENERGKNHFVFGGILQSYTQNQGPEGNPVYTVQVVDPREILSNCSVILKNYAGSVYGNKNYFNVYGFLEYDPSDSLKAEFNQLSIPGYIIGGTESIKNWNGTGYTPFFDVNGDPIVKTNNLLEKIVDYATGDTFYYGNDMYRFNPILAYSPLNYPEFFPITGQGMSRICDQGIPWYRVRQALNALFNYGGDLPAEYVDKGFGGPINFRGYNYVVDFTGIPLEKIPQMYFLDFEKIDLLSLIQELCDIISHDFIVSLLPIIDHPACKTLFDYNNYWSIKNPSQIITGIIRVDTIDKSIPPTPGSIQSYLNDLENKGIKVENKDVGYELSNDTTDNMVVGAQEIEMYYFTNNKDRDNLQLRKAKEGLKNAFEELQADQWKLETSLKQQILPFYGFLGKDVVTIPRGFGSYQQIMLDTSGLNAYGVGNYYIATELELRAAAISYENWSRFLTEYNELYMEEVGEDATFFRSLAARVPANDDVWKNSEFASLFNANKIFDGSREFAVTVPRCVYISDKNYVDEDGYPASPCAPPYGYPLYYKRAQKIGIPEAGIVGFQNALTECASNFGRFKDIASKRDELVKMQTMVKNEEAKLRIQLSQLQPNTFAYKHISNKITTAMTKASELNNKLSLALSAQENATYIKDVLSANSRFVKSLNRLAAQSMRNARKVYNFLKQVADKHLGRTFLVKIPKGCNTNYSSDISISAEGINVNNIVTGPYGFKPQPIFNDIGYFNQLENFISSFSQNQSAINSVFTYYIDYTQSQYTYGALKNNFNPITDKWEFNYNPEPQGGFFNYSLFDRNLSLSPNTAIELANTKLPFAQQQLLAPMDLTNFVDEGRIKCYVRYDHSELLDLSSVGSDNFTQQLITSYGYIPDIMEELNNIDDNKFAFQDKITANQDNINPPSVAFVKCDIDPQFYMIPKFGPKKTPVYGRTYEFSANYAPIKMIEVKNQQGCKEIKPAQPYAYPIFTVGRKKDGGFDGTEVVINDFNMYYSRDLNANIISTEKYSLNSDHVYAIITVPNRIMPTYNQRYLDGPAQAMNGASIKHILTMDVVRGMPGFDSPAPITRKKNTTINCDLFTFDQLNEARLAQKTVTDKIGFANPELKIGFNSPSPVYPDLVVLPLMSMERCYGPWFSSSIVGGANNKLRYSNIGGKVEYIKDENLAPWNYGGFQLMNEAGSLQAQFGNSLKLFSERGGFVIPDAPMGISIARALQKGGPLVTSISVDIGDKVTTTVKMDLYTARFGKLQKQKEGAIARIVRERQKIIDQNNSMIRKGIGKSVSNVNLHKMITNAGGATIKSLASVSSNNLNAIESSLVTGRTVQTNVIASVIPNTQKVVPEGETTSVDNTSYEVTASIQSPSYITETMGLFENEADFRKAYQASAGGNLMEYVRPFSKDVGNPYMPSQPYLNITAIQERIS